MKIEAQDQRVDYPVEFKIVRKYGCAFRILTPPDEVLLAMKFCALLGRAKGRDLYDIVFLMSQGIVPDLDFLRQKRSDITSLEQLYKISLDVLQREDPALKIRDVEHLLINPIERQQIALLPDILRDEFSRLS